MPRHKIADPEADISVESVHKKTRGRPRNDDSDDPRAALAVGVVQEPSKTPPKLARDTSGDMRYRVYVRALVANNGDIAEALAQAYGVEREEAERRMVELHGDIVAHSRAGTSLQEQLEQHDLTRESRLAVLRDALFSKNPGVALKAVEMLDEVDMTAKAARIGNTWDEIVRVAQDRAMRKKRAK